MLKTVIALITIVFSMEVLADDKPLPVSCFVKLPSDCTELVDSDISFHEETEKENPNKKQTFLDIKVTCKFDEKRILVDASTVGEMYLNHKIYVTSIPVNSPSKDFIIHFPKPEEKPEFIYALNVACNFE